MTPLPGCTDMKPGSCTFPFFGIEPVLLDQQTGSVVSGPGKGILAIKSTWPSVTRTIFGNHQRYLDTYMNTYPSHYFTVSFFKFKKLIDRVMVPIVILTDIIGYMEE